MKTVFFDIDTQLDFVSPAGALSVPGAESILANVARLNHYAVRARVPLISTVDAHTEADPEFKLWPHHCVAGCLGQRKPQATLVGEGQIILEKQSTDCFTVPRLHTLLAELAADRYVVYGVVTEICVKHCVDGLLKLGKPISIVTDAIRELDPLNASSFLSAFTAGGGLLTTTAEAIG